MDAIKSLVQPLMGGSSVVDGMKLVVLGGTVETARRVSSSAWSHFVNSFFLTAHFCEEEHPYDWLMLWLSRRPEWQRSREFETTIRSGTSHTSSYASPADAEWDEAEQEWEAFNGSELDGTGNYRPGGDEDDSDPIEKPKTRIVFQPTYDTTHTIFFRGHWLRVKRCRKLDHNSNSEVISISVIARSNNILKQLVLQAKKEYEAECVHRIQIYFADAHGSWRWTDSRAKRPLSSIVLNPGVKEMLVDDAKDFLRSEKWYADRGIPFRRGYLLYGVPGSGKSSLIHALAGYLQLDIYVVSLSASFISDSTLTSLMGRVPARCVVLLEDLDAAFTRSTSRDDDDDLLGNSNNTSGSGNNNGSGGGGGFGSGAMEGPEPPSGFSSFYGSSRRRSGRSGGRGGDYLSDVNTLSLSGLLNALDGVAASEGRLLFATTNHLDKLDEALRRPGRMDVWIEFRNASKWQAEALFRNFFPAVDDDDEDEDDDGNRLTEAESDERKAKMDLERQKTRQDARDADRRREKEVEEAMKNIRVESRMFTPNPSSLAASSASGSPPSPSTPTSVWSIASSATSLLSSASSSLSLSFPSSGTSTPSSSISRVPSSSTPTNSTTSTSAAASGSSTSKRPANKSTTSANEKPQKKFGDTNTAYIPPPPTDDVAEKLRHSAAPLDKKTLAVLAKSFADGVPEEEFSVAGLQGYLLKHKSNPHHAATSISAWVDSERQIRAKLAKEKALREAHEAKMREQRRKELIVKREEKRRKDEKEKEMEKIKEKLAEKEKEEELEKMREKLREKEEGKKEEAAEGDKKDGDKKDDEDSDSSDDEAEKEKKEEKDKKEKEKPKEKKEKEKPKETTTTTEKKKKKKSAAVVVDDATKDSKSEKEKDEKKKTKEKEKEKEKGSETAAVVGKSEDSEDDEDKENWSDALP